MNYLFLFLSILLNLTTWAHAFELKNNSLILTHTSLYYHSSLEAVLSTQELIKNSSGDVIALAQNPLHADQEWYGLPLGSIDFEFESRAGEHKLQFPELLTESDFNLTAAGGYLSACLGRTLSTLVANFTKTSGSLKTLNIYLPSKTIFTGFLSSDEELIPKTPYRESILDDTIDGLNFHQVLGLVSNIEITEFMKETILIAIYKKSPMNDVHQAQFSLEIKLEGKTIHKFGEEEPSKKIILHFEK